MKLRQMTDQQAAKWARLQADGPLRFVLFRGVLGWGVPTAVIFAFLTAPFDAFHESFTKSLLRSLVLFPLFGIVWGLAMWWLGKKQYRSWTELRGKTQL
jgi:hypothetical protein